MYQYAAAWMSAVIISASAVVAVGQHAGEKVERDPVEKALSTGFKSLESGWQEYQRQHRTLGWACQSSATGGGESCTRTIDNPGYLPVDDWSETLTPAYVFMPRPPAGMNWSYGHASEGYYFCAKEVTQRSLLQNLFASLSRGLDTTLRRLTGGEDIFVADRCGATSSSEPDATSPLKVTYWLEDASLPHSVGPPATPIMEGDKEDEGCRPYAGPEWVAESWRRVCGYMNTSFGRLVCTQVWLLGHYGDEARDFYHFLDGGRHKPCSN